jgi:hypothetical protein
LDDADAVVDKEMEGSRGIISEVCTYRKLVFESNQIAYKGQHFLRQQTQCMEGSFAEIRIQEIWG